MSTTSFVHRSNPLALLATPFAIASLALLGIGCAAGGGEDDQQSASAAQGSPGGSGGAGAEPSTAITGGAAGAAGAENGGAAGAAASASGGEAGAAGAAGSGGSDDPPPACNQGEKLCSTGCVAKGPETGCGSVGCSPCNTPPANSKGTCDGALCDFECLPGFVRKGFSCVADSGGGGGSGGSGGAGGTGGSSGSTGGSGGGLQICVAPCTPSDPTSQFFCMAACVSKGTAGLCAPALNCCVCG